MGHTETKPKKDIIFGLNISRLFLLIWGLIILSIYYHFAIYLVLSATMAIFIILLIFILLSISASISAKHLKDYKRFSGRYSIRPPQGYYDYFDFEDNEMY